MNDFVFYIQQGFYHVLDINALDHVLFFIALSVVYTFKDWKKAFWLITSFTIAHSITFGLSVYGKISVGINLVEFLIPITILIPVLINIYHALNKSVIKKDNTNVYFSFFFGLIHGLGFSNFFKMLLDEGDNKLLPLLNFSIGIELAQIVIVGLLLITNYLMSFYIKRKTWVISVSILLALIIIPMILKRIPF